MDVLQMGRSQTPGEKMTIEIKLEIKAGIKME